MKLGSWRVVIAIVLVGLLLDALLPVAAGRMIARGLRQERGWQVEETVVKARPGLALLAGRFEQVELRASTVPAGKISLRDVQIEVHKGRIIWQRDGVRFTGQLESPADLVVDAVIGERELSVAVQQAVPQLRQVAVTISPDGIELNTEYAGLPIRITGRLVADGPRLRFAAQQVVAGGAQASRLTGLFLAEVPVADLANLKIPLTIRRVQMEEGRILLSAVGLK